MTCTHVSVCWGLTRHRLLLMSSNVPLETESFHDANFVVIRWHIPSDDKIGIVIAIGFQLHKMRFQFVGCSWCIDEIFFGGLSYLILRRHDAHILQSKS